MTSPTRRAHSERVLAVLRVVDAARKVAGRADDIAPQIASDTGLSPEGVAWAFAHHLETSPTGAEIERLVASVDEAPSVAVILSANVFTAALRALALACAAAPRVVVRPSRRDPTFAAELVAALADAAVSLAPDLAVDALAEGEIHVYGHDATIEKVRATARPSVRVRGHGSGMGVAFVSAAAAPGACADGLARDVVAFDQRGCLSPRVVLVHGDDARAGSFGEALDRALGSLGARVPRGRLDESERAEGRRFEDALTFAGTVLGGPGHVVAVGGRGAPLVVPPPGRHVLVVPVADVASAREALGPFARYVVAVGGDTVEAARLVAPSHARVSALGEMQRPPLDGPVDRRRA